MLFKSKSTSHHSRRLVRVVCCTLSVFVVGLLTACNGAQAADADQTVRVNLSEAGVLSGRVVTMLDSEGAPVVARVSLSSDGVTVATRTTDVAGNFSFEDVQPGSYEMVGVSGDYVGSQSIIVGEPVVGVESGFELQVIPATNTTVAPFANAPMSSYSSSIVTRSAYGSGGGGGVSSGGLGGSQIVGRNLFGASSLRRLLLIGGAVAVPVAVSGDDEVVSPDE